MTLKLHEPTREEWVAAMSEPGPDRLFNVWAEGFSVTGEHARASVLGSARAPSFAEACQVVMAKHAEAPRYFDPARLTYWSCRLFPVESDARASCG